MKAAIINGADVGDRILIQAQEALVAELGKRCWEVRTLHLAEQSIAPCTACFSCWLKTPGICARDDDGKKIPATLIGNDLNIMLTPVVYGGFGPLLKSAMDRSIPILLPYFRLVQGEVHHPSRYMQQYNLLVVGTLPAPDADRERIFSGLVERNAINMSSRQNFAGVLYQNEDASVIATKVSGFLEKVGVAL